jgi:hypothetical protein
MAATEKIFTPKMLVQEHPEIGSEGYLANLRSQRRGACYFKRNRKVLYRECDVLKWLLENPIKTLDQHD